MDTSSWLVDLLTYTRVGKTRHFENALEDQTRLYTNLRLFFICACICKCVILKDKISDIHKWMKWDDRDRTTDGSCNPYTQYLQCFLYFCLCWWERASKIKNIFVIGQKHLKGRKGAQNGNNCVLQLGVE